MKTECAEAIRLTLDVSPELNDILDDLAAKQHTTKEDVLLKAIAFAKFAQDEQSKGRRIGSATPEQDLATELVEFW